MTQAANRHNAVHRQDAYPESRFTDLRSDFTRGRDLGADGSKYLDQVDCGTVGDAIRDACRSEGHRSSLRTRVAPAAGWLRLRSCSFSLLESVNALYQKLI